MDWLTAGLVGGNILSGLFGGSGGPDKYKPLNYNQWIRRYLKEFGPETYGLTKADLAIAAEGYRQISKGAGVGNVRGLQYLRNIGKQRSALGASMGMQSQAVAQQNALQLTRRMVALSAETAMKQRAMWMELGEVGYEAASAERARAAGLSIQSQAQDWSQFQDIVSSFGDAVYNYQILDALKKLGSMNTSDSWAPSAWDTSSGFIDDVGEEGIFG